MQPGAAGSEKQGPWQGWAFFLEKLVDGKGNERLWLSGALGRLNGPLDV